MAAVNAPVLVMVAAAVLALWLTLVVLVTDTDAAPAPAPAPTLPLLFANVSLCPATLCALPPCDLDGDCLPGSCAAPGVCAVRAEPCTPPGAVCIDSLSYGPSMCSLGVCDAAERCHVAAGAPHYACACSCGPPP